MVNKKTKILIVSVSLSGGGAERFASTLINHLDRSNFIPSLCLFKDDITYPLPSDVPVFVLEKRKAWHTLRTIKRLRKLIEQIRPHVILSTFELVSRFAGIALLGAKTESRWIARIACKPLIHVPLEQLVVNLWSKIAYSQADSFVANAKKLAWDFLSYYPSADGRVETIYTPIDFDYIEKQARTANDFIVKADKPVIISIGRFEKQKRFDILLDSFALLHNQVEAELIICGQGKLKAEIEKRAKRLNLNDSVKIIDYQNNPYAIMKKASVFVLTSDYEGLPNALIEAQGLGVPAVSTKCPFGPDEIIEDGITGILTPVGDSKAIAEALRLLLMNKKLLEAMGAAAKDRVRKKFDKSVLIREWEQMLLRKQNT